MTSHTRHSGKPSGGLVDGRRKAVRGGKADVLRQLVCDPNNVEDSGWSPNDEWHLSARSSLLGAWRVASVPRSEYFANRPGLMARRCLSRALRGAERRLFRARPAAPALRE